MNNSIFQQRLSQVDPFLWFAYLSNVCEPWYKLTEKENRTETIFFFSLNISRHEPLQVISQPQATLSLKQMWKLLWRLIVLCGLISYISGINICRRSRSPICDFSHHSPYIILINTYTKGKKTYQSLQNCCRSLLYWATMTLETKSCTESSNSSPSSLSKLCSLSDLIIYAHLSSLALFFFSLNHVIV